MFNNFTERMRYFGEASRMITSDSESVMKYTIVCAITGFIVGAIQIYAKTKEFV